MDRAIRELGGLLDAVIASRIPERTWYRWRMLGRIPDPEAIFKIADLTGIPARELAGLVQHAAPPPRRGRRTKANVPVSDCNRNHGSRMAPTHLTPVSRDLAGLAA